MDSAPLRSLERESRPGYAPFHLGLAGHAHNEAAFRHFLGIELRRARRSGRSVMLVLVNQRHGRDLTRRLATNAAEEIFSVLGASVREVDFVGWFHEGRVAAAALIQRTGSSADVRQCVATRVTQKLRSQTRDADAWRVRVVALHGHQHI